MEADITSQPEAWVCNHGVSHAGEGYCPTSLKEAMQGIPNLDVGERHDRTTKDSEGKD